MIRAADVAVLVARLNYSSKATERWGILTADNGYKIPAKTSVTFYILTCCALFLNAGLFSGGVSVERTGTTGGLLASSGIRRTASGRDALLRMGR